MKLTRIGLRSQGLNTAIGMAIPGGGKFRSATAAFVKCSRLEDVLQTYFQNSSAYDGSHIDEGDVPKAIQYVISKKLTKAARQGTKGALVFGAAAAGAIAGATAGSIIPGAGTIGGGVLGGVGIGTLASGGVFVADRTGRDFQVRLQEAERHSGRASASGRPRPVSQCHQQGARIQLRRGSGYGPGHYSGRRVSGSHGNGGRSGNRTNRATNQVCLTSISASSSGLRESRPRSGP